MREFVGPSTPTITTTTTYEDTAYTTRTTTATANSNNTVTTSTTTTSSVYRPSPRNDPRHEPLYHPPIEALPAMAGMGLGGINKNDFAEVEMRDGSFQGRISDQDEHVFNLEHAATFQTTYEQAAEGKLFHDGELITLPAPTRDPKDPMNLSLGRRVAGVFCLSFFGALAASAEIILGACLPVFALNYAPAFNYEYKVLATFPSYPVGSNPLSLLNSLGGPPIFEVYLLAALPLLMIGVSNLFFIPLAIAIGRRPVVLGTGCVAIGGALWAGLSTSLWSHIGARCVQAVGAGTVESLIPFIIQDMIPVHQRNTWISAAFAAQGVIIIAIGFSAPYIIININWNWVYFITCIAAAVFLFGVFLFLPETRWNRTRAEMSKWIVLVWQSALSIRCQADFTCQTVFLVMMRTFTTSREPSSSTWP